MMFDFFWKRKPKTTLPFIDMWFDEQQLMRMYELLSPFASVDSNLDGGGTKDSLLQLAAQARDLLRSDRVIIRQQAREIEQLTEQLDEVTRNREEIYNNAVEQIKELKQELEDFRITYDIQQKELQALKSRKKKPVA